MMKPGLLIFSRFNHTLSPYFQLPLVHKAIKMQTCQQMVWHKLTLEDILYTLYSCKHPWKRENILLACSYTTISETFSGTIKQKDQICEASSPHAPDEVKTHTHSWAVVYIGESTVQLFSQGRLWGKQTLNMQEVKKKIKSHATYYSDETRQQIKYAACTPIQKIQGLHFHRNTGSGKLHKL